MLVKMFHGFCMALADSVPGVSGGTVAFILGFYEKFIDALHGLFGKDNGARKAAVLLPGCSDTVFPKTKSVHWLSAPPCYWIPPAPVPGCGGGSCS